MNLHSNISMAPVINGECNFTFGSPILQLYVTLFALHFETEDV